MNFLGIIPSRFASTRFPGKPLVKIAGKSMIRRVYEQASKALETVYVATDDQRIYDEVAGFGGKAVFTSLHHKSGTDRCSEAVMLAENREKTRVDIVLNIQGDEPFIRPEQISLLCNCFKDENTDIATLVMPFKTEESVFDTNKVKVVVDKNGYALYFSRSVIPYNRNSGIKEEWIRLFPYFRHIGMYAFRKDVLLKIAKLPPSPLENAESLEQLRWLENGFRIKTERTAFESVSIDTPEDLKLLEERGMIDDN